MEIFSKKLTSTDVKNRLSIKTSSLEHFPRFQGGENAQVVTAEDEEGNEWHFRMIIRTGKYRKPVLSAGWLRFVKEKKVENGFMVHFFREKDGVTGELKYKIQVKKPIKLFGSLMYGSYPEA